ncbi:MAG: TetR/AcrR family transcriptional regulator [Lachnospiraceae bacterium]|nr:TetR/AcrR family transcriptional regulator [Lachnospiraceae bacterium]
MPRKESVTEEMILNTAFEMAKNEGFENVTARKVSAAVGCSTQPIFRVYENMEGLLVAVYEKASQYFLDYFKEYDKSSLIPFGDLGLAYISFAKEEKNLFKLLFVSDFQKKKSMYELLNGNDGNVVREINLARQRNCKDPEGLFMKMWIFIHGAACMSLTGDYDLDNAQTSELLVASYAAFSR